MTWQCKKKYRFMVTKEKTMKLEEYTLPPISEEQILVRNDYTSVSIGTEIYDYINWEKNGQKVCLPITSGYCSAGIVIEAGKKVTKVRPGDRVCGQGYHSNYSVLDEPYQSIPEGVSTKEASLMVMAAVALRGVRRASIELGEAVAVLGVGIIGQLAMSLARLSGGSPIIAIDLNDSKLKKARKRGADYCINPGSQPDYVQYVRDICSDNGVNTVIEVTGKPSVYPTALKLACNAGKVISLGSPRGVVEMNFLPDMHKRELQLIGAFQPGTPPCDHVYYHWTKDRDRNLILRLMADKRLHVLDLITTIAMPSECQSIYQMLSKIPNDQLGVVFDWR